MRKGLTRSARSCATWSWGFTQSKRAVRRLTNSQPKGGASGAGCCPPEVLLQQVPLLKGSRHRAGVMELAPALPKL